jgi:plasmid segregation protein ParM
MKVRDLTGLYGKCYYLSSSMFRKVRNFPDHHRTLRNGNKKGFQVFTNYQTYAYGHDFGNSKTCGVAYMPGGQPVALEMPSTLAAGTMEELMSNVSGASVNNLREAGITTQTSHIISFRHGGKNWSFYGGDLAIIHNPHADMKELTWRGTVSRYWSERNLAALLMTSGTLIKDREYGLAVVTQLPIRTHDETNVKQVKQTLDGDYDFVLDGAKRTAHITIKKTIKEGVGASLAYGGSNGSEKIGIIDIGGRTGDAFQLQNQITLPGSQGTIDRGVETVADGLAETFVDRFRYPLSAQDARELLFRYVHGQPLHTVQSIVESEVSSSTVSQMIEDAIVRVGSEFVPWLKLLWSGSLQVDVVAQGVSRILLVGGGAYYFESALKPLFKKRLIVLPDPEFANAGGCAKLALHYLQREQQRAQV